MFDLVDRAGRDLPSFTPGAHVDVEIGPGLVQQYSLCNSAAERHRDFTLHYCVRSADRAAFLGRMADSPFAGKVDLHIDDGEAAQKLNLDAAIAALPGAHIYICGPAGFIDFVRAGAKARGVPGASVHVEYFAVPVVAAPAGNQPFQVQLASSGQTFDVGANETIIDVLERAGVAVDVSCCEGICGTCVVRVLEGEPDHRDLILTEKERTVLRQFMPCCSRARSKLLVLNL